MSEGWIGVDLDGTLAHEEAWQNPSHIGKPIAPMVARVKGWLAEGKQVKIFTARGELGVQSLGELADALTAIDRWCEEHLGQVLPITATKDHQMIECWDDRCVQLVPNTGLTLREALRHPETLQVEEPPPATDPATPPD